MCKLDLKDAYFSVPQHPKHQKFACLKWKESVYQFLCLCFWLGQAPRIFTKLMNVPIALLRRLNIRLTIFSGRHPINGNSSRGIGFELIFLLQNLGFLINAKKSQFQSSNF